MDSSEVARGAGVATANTVSFNPRCALPHRDEMKPLLPHHKGRCCTLTSGTLFLDYRGVCVCECTRFGESSARNSRDVISIPALFSARWMDEECVCARHSRGLSLRAINVSFQCEMFHA